MRAARKGINVNILGKDFSVACDDNEREDLEAAASYLDRKMREIQRGGKVIGAERCAIMAALNITHEFLALRHDTDRANEVELRLKTISQKIETAIKDQKQLSL